MSEAIRVACPGCKKTIKAPAHYAGKVASCPGCGHQVRIDDPELAELFGDDLLPSPSAAFQSPPPLPSRSTETEADFFDSLANDPTLGDPDAIVFKVKPEETTCPYCAETIKAEAVKCKHCGEFLDRRLRQQAAASTLVETKPSLGVAMVLSLVIPGAGQMYRGNVGFGLVWLFCTAIGYAFFIIPGLVLHVLCIVTAGTKD